MSVCLTLCFICPGQHNDAVSNFPPLSKQVAVLGSTGVPGGVRGTQPAKGKYADGEGTCSLG